MRKFITKTLYLMLSIMSLLLPISQIKANEVGTTLSIPSIGVEASITDVGLLPDYSTWDVSQLQMNVGHLLGTSWFGGGSNTVLAGHSETPSLEPDIFYQLDAVQIGDIITVTTGGQQFQYVVTEVRSVSVYDMSIVYPSAGEQLTLFTCQRDTYNASTGLYQNRVVVIAVPL